MARISGGINFNLEHEGDEVKHVMDLIRKLPEALETYNSSISIRNKNRISKEQLSVVEEWGSRTDSFQQYLDGMGSKQNHEKNKL